MRCLVTGASGFVGANLARRLAGDDHDVHVVLRSQKNSWRLENLLEDVHVHSVDLCKDPLGPVVEAIKPQWIFHLAAYGAYSWEQDLAKMVQTNIAGTMNLMQACLHHGFEAFVNAGSSSEYGCKDHPPKETECPEPNSHYAVTKVAATMYCQHTARKERAPISTLRLYSVYGAYEDPNRLMPTLIERGLDDQFPPLASPDIARDYVYVDDVVDAFLLAAAHKTSRLGAIYNLGTGVQTSLRTVVDLARQVLSIQDEPHWGSMPDRQWDTTCWVADNQLIRQELGWAPRYEFAAGFEQMVKWHRVRRAEAARVSR